jgi:hypothetical protein
VRGGRGSWAAEPSEMRGLGEGEGGGVDPAAPWMTSLVIAARDGGRGVRACEMRGRGGRGSVAR